MLGSMLARRSLATAATTGKAEGTIASVFASLSGDADLGANLPARFADLKASFIQNDTHVNALTRAWQDVLHTLRRATAEVAARPDDIIPEITYPTNANIARQPLDQWISPQKVAEIRQRGAAVITGVVAESQALEWKRRVRDYAAANPMIRGFPEDNKQVYEMYWSKPQIEARAHPNLQNTTRAFLKLFNAPHQQTSSPVPTALAISLNNPVMYADRLRIRQPGDAKFALGPHIDGGGVERWEDPAFKSYWKRILEGRCDWREHDSWSLGDNGERLSANGDLYQGPGQCSVFRPFQGWLSMSHTRRNEGTLKVLPLLKEASAYIMLRPFFRPVRTETPASKDDPQYTDAFLDASNWVFDATTASFPGCSLGHNIELNNVTHPHLALHKTMTSIPRVTPGSVVLWHTDLVHAVEARHQGSGDSSVMYIPAVPLTANNFDYVLRQREAFLQGTPPADFPGGDGEKACTGRAQVDDIVGEDARKAMGFAIFDPNSAETASERSLLDAVNVRL